MKTNVYIFTFDGDRELVPMCVAALRHSAAKLGDGDSVHVTVVDDGNARAWEDEESALAACGADSYTVTDWPRCGNLNKAACVEGMLRMYDTAPADSDWVMQVDSDTLLRSFEQLRDARADIVGIGPYDIITDKPFHPVVSFVGGAAMAIRRERVPVLLETLERPGFRERIDKGRGFSDRVICALNMIAYGSMEQYWHDRRKKVTEDVDFYEARLTSDNIECERTRRALVLHCDHRLCKERAETVPVMRRALELYFGIGM